MNGMKMKASLLAASALTLAAGFAAPAEAGRWDNLVSECCGVGWEFKDHHIHINIEPDYFKLSALTSICAEQIFHGSMESVSKVAWVDVKKDLSNAATAAANVISVNGGTDNKGETVRSPYAAVVEAVQKASGWLDASAEVKFAKVGKDLTNSATAAANLIDIQSTTLGLLEGTQIAGGMYHPMHLHSKAGVYAVKVDKDLTNSATSAANIASVNVTPDKGKSKDVSLALVDMTQLANVHMSSYAGVGGAIVKGDLTNSATSAANVISVINK